MSKIVRCPSCSRDVELTRGVYCPACGKPITETGEERKRHDGGGGLRIAIDTLPPDSPWRDPRKVPHLPVPPRPPSPPNPPSIAAQSPEPEPSQGSSEAELNLDEVSLYDWPIKRIFPTLDQIREVISYAYANGPGEDTKMSNAAGAVPPSPPNPQSLLPLVQEVHHWGKIHASKKDDQAAAQALYDIWSSIQSLPNAPRGLATANQVVSLWKSLLAAMAANGIVKHHYAWASKILHWVCPTHVPIYDMRVRVALGIAFEDKLPELAYRIIVYWAYGCLAWLQQGYAKDELEAAIKGVMAPTYLRAIDIYLWQWYGTEILGTSGTSSSGGILRI